MFMYTCVTHTYVHRALACTCLFMCMYVLDPARCVHRPTRMSTFTHARKHTFIHTLMHTHKRTLIHTLTCTPIHTLTYTHSHTHTYTHTYTHTLTYVRSHMIHIECTHTETAYLLLQWHRRWKVHKRCLIVTRLHKQKLIHCITTVSTHKCNTDYIRQFTLTYIHIHTGIYLCTHTHTDAHTQSQSHVHTHTDVHTQSQSLTPLTYKLYTHSSTHNTNT